MKKNILIVDDSALMRRVLSDIINSDDELQSVDFAFNGIMALEMVQKNTYDCIVLDIQMPKMNGVEFMRQINEKNIDLNVVLVSSVASESGEETIQCLGYGAFDFVKKPASLTDIKGASFSKTILDLIHLSIDSAKPKAMTKKLPTQAEIVKKREIISTKSVKSGVSLKGSKLIALACSTGGPKALQEVIPLLPDNLDAPMVIVQHMPEGFTKSLAERLDAVSKVKVREAEEGDVLTKGNVYIAKGGCHLKVNNKPGGGGVLSLSNEPPRGGLRPCADIMYESLVDSSYDQIICVVLTGMGADGTSGINYLKNKKKLYVISQDKDSCTVYGMPKMIYESGVTDEVRPLSDIASAITSITGVR